MYSISPSLQSTSTLARRKFLLYNRRPKEHNEPKKVIIHKSLLAAFLYSFVHLVPMLTSLLIISLNLKGYYIGSDFAGFEKAETVALLLLQILAKFQELLIVASLATIIFHLVRHELLFGDGLPLGLIGSGFAFDNVGFFFTREFYGSLSYVGNTWRKFGFLTILVLAGLTASLAGPASAVLLVPKSQDWRAGGTSFFLDGGMDDFWPIYLNANSTGPQPYCGTRNSTDYGVCPSGGYNSLWEHFSTATSSNYRIATAARPYAKALSGSRFYWPIESPLSQIPSLFALGGARSNDQVEVGTYLVQPHAATCIMLQQIMTDWWAAFLSKTRHNPDKIDDRRAQSEVRSPITQTRCSAPRNLSSTETNVNFPTISGWASWAKGIDIPVGSLNSTAVDHIRFQWVHLPDEFGAVTIGSVFESPWIGTGNASSRVVIGCTVQSAWIPTTLYTDEYTFWTGWYPWNIKFGARYPPWTQPKEGVPVSPTNGRISVADDWLSMLTPPTPLKGPGYYPWGPSTMESILTNVGFAETVLSQNESTLTQDWRNQDLSGSGKSLFLEAIICSVFVDGVARSGSHRVYNTSGPASDWILSEYTPKTNFDSLVLKGKDAVEAPALAVESITKLHVDMHISGYAFKNSLAESLAIALLLVHIVLASLHTFWLLFRRETSTSWHSVSKMIALAQNSQPAYVALENTAAGIKRKNTYARMAKIRVTKIPGSLDADHVEIVFQSEPKQELPENEPMKTFSTSTTNTARDLRGPVRDPGLGSISADDFQPSLRNPSPHTWPRANANDTTTSLASSEFQFPERPGSSESISHLIEPSMLVDDRIVRVNRKYG